MRRRDDEKERRIKDAVIELMLEEGFHGTSISKIARKAEVSPATVYIYYERGVRLSIGKGPAQYGRLSASRNIDS